MTISTTTVKNSYSGNASTTAFAYTFKISDDDDIVVIIRSAAGTETVKTKTTHYTVAGVGNSSGGTITFTSGNTPASGETVLLRRESSNTQATDLVENSPLSAETLETALDAAVMNIQELQEEVDRSIKISRSNTMTSTDFTNSATDRASKILAFDSSGEISVTQELGTFKGNWAASTAYVIRDIVKDTNTNNIFICVTAHSSSGSVPLTTNTDSAKWSLLVDAASATTSQTAAATSATAAASSATAAASSASTASGHKDTATTKASEAASSATAAASSATSAAASYDTFDDRFLGAKSSDPSADNDGDSLATGALYFNTSNNVMMVYNGSAWQRTTPTSSNQTNINTVAADATDIGNVSGSISNVNTVAGSISNVNTTAGSISNVNTVAGAIANVNTTASNISGVNSFADRYRVASSAPSSSLDEGDLYYDTSANTLNFYNGSAWSAIVADTDVKVLVSSNDSTAGFLNGKLVAGTAITFAEANDGSNETLTINATDPTALAIALG